MGILVNEHSRILVQGITGQEGSFHARACRTYGTNVVAGETPRKRRPTLRRRSTYI
ncbi:MAG: hypothetical protein Ct9H300mP27_05010 [Chloroflexota bacterium]|nr:MAG: hypothetical protein Ct9H300mP27_05010 [Chloroflexota bacterium]